MRVYPPMRYPRGFQGLGQQVDDSGNVTGPAFTDPTPVITDPVDVGQAGLTPWGTVATTGSGQVGSSSSGSTVAQDIAALGPTLAASAKALSAATGPYQISGTNYIYNPATGQILLNGAAVGMYNPGTGALTALNASGSFASMLPMILGVGAIVLVVSMLGGRK